MTFLRSTLTLLRHHQLDRIAERGADHRERDAGVAGGRVEDGLARTQQAAARCRRAIIFSAGRSFTEPPGLKPSSLAKTRTPGGTPSRERADLDQRRVADQVERRSSAGERRRSPGRAGRMRDCGGARASGGGSAPPAMAGTIEISSPSFTGVSRFVQEADVLAVHEDVDEAAHLAALVADALLDARDTAFEIVDHGGDGRAVGLTASAPPVYLRSGVGILTWAMMSILLRLPVAVASARSPRQPADASPAVCSVRRARRSRRAARGCGTGCSTVSTHRLERLVAVAGDADDDRLVARDAALLDELLA